MDAPARLSPITANSAGCTSRRSAKKPTSRPADRVEAYVGRAAGVTCTKPSLNERPWVPAVLSVSKPFGRAARCPILGAARGCRATPERAYDLEVSPDALFEWFASYATAFINVFAAGVRLLPVSFAFSAGMIATVNPCGFIMLPSFAAFYVATDDRATPSLGPRVARAGLMGLLVSLAFIATFATVGLAVIAVGNQLIGWSYWAGLAIGLVMATFGAYQLATRRSIFSNLTSGIRVTRSRTTKGVLAFGFAYAVVSLGCTLPIFMLVVGSIFTDRTDYLTSLWRFVQYGAGMGFVLIVVAIGVSVARQPVVRFVSGALPWINVLANAALVFAGLYVTWYWWRALT